MARSYDEHPSRLDFVASACLLVGGEIAGEILLELQSDAAAHGTGAVDRIDQSLSIFRQNIAGFACDYELCLNLIRRFVICPFKPFFQVIQA